jgi:hypothetical protein
VCKFRAPYHNAVDKLLHTSQTLSTKFHKNCYNVDILEPWRVLSLGLWPLRVKFVLWAFTLGQLNCYNPLSSQSMAIV